MDKTELGNKIKRIRLEKGLTMEEFGKLVLNAKKNSVSNWEKGKMSPNIGRLQKIAEIGGLSLAELLGMDTDSVPSEFIGVELEPQVIAINEQVKKALDEAFPSNNPVQQMLEKMQTQMEPFRKMLEEKLAQCGTKLEATTYEFEVGILKLIQEHGIAPFREKMQSPMPIAFAKELVKRDPAYMEHLKKLCEDNSLDYDFIMEYAPLLKNSPYLKENQK